MLALLLCLLATQGCATRYVLSLGVDQTHSHPLLVYPGSRGDLAVGVSTHVSHPWPRIKDHREFCRVIYADSAAVVQSTEENGFALLESMAAWEATGRGDKRRRGGRMGPGCPAVPATRDGDSLVPEVKRLNILLSDRKDSPWRMLPGRTDHWSDLRSILPPGFADSVRVTVPPHCSPFTVASGADSTHLVLGEFRVDSGIVRSRAWWSYPTQLLLVPAAAVDVVLAPILFVMILRNPPY